MDKRKDWVPYDPSWLVKLAREQHPDLPWLHEVLASCTLGRHESKAYIHFVDARNPNQPGSEWQFETNIFVDSPSKGRIILDILKDQRVGGVEFVDRI